MRSLDRDLGTLRAVFTRMTGFRSACAHRFSPYSVERGEELASDSRVTLLERAPPSFLARVDEETVSIVALPLASPHESANAAAAHARMFSACSCPLFALGLDGCRHIWALVAFIDDAGLVPPDAIGEGFDLAPRHGRTSRTWASARRVRDRDADTVRARHRARLGGMRPRARLTR